MSCVSCVYRIYVGSVGRNGVEVLMSKWLECELLGVVAEVSVCSMEGGNEKTVPYGGFEKTMNYIISGVGEESDVLEGSDVLEYSSSESGVDKVEDIRDFFSKLSNVVVCISVGDGSVGDGSVV